MKIGIIGTGVVGTTLGKRLVELGHEVRLGSRHAGGEAATKWVKDAGEGASEGDLASTASFGEVIFNCTPGGSSLGALAQAGADNIGDKVLIDVSNPLVHSDSGLSLSVCNTDSVGEQIQRAYPRAKVVKAFNTLNCSLMLNPLADPGLLPICGDDQGKAWLVGLLTKAGWPREAVVDLGDITKARATEAAVLLWVEMFKYRQSPQFNWAVVS